MMKHNIKHLTKTLSDEIVGKINEIEDEFADLVLADFKDELDQQENAVDRLKCVYKWYKHVQKVKNV